MSEKKPLVDTFNVNEGVAGEWHVVRLRTKPRDDGQITWVDIEVFVVPAFGVGDNKPMFYATDEFELNSNTEDLDAAEPSITGFVKGDGCTQLWFHDEPVHIDHADELQALFTALKDARSKALEIMEASGGTW